MDPISIIVMIVIVGLIVWAVNTFLPIPAPFKTLVYVVAVVFLLIYLLRAIGHPIHI